MTRAQSASKGSATETATRSTEAAQPSPLSAAAHARLLAEALPYMQRYSGQTVIVKFGGHAMGEPQLSADFAQDVVLLKQSGVNPIVVHGGGPQIAGMLKRLQLKSEFVNGLRVTDKPTVEVVEMVLAGLINKDIARAVRVSIDAGRDLAGASILRLAGPGLQATSEVTLGGAQVDISGEWKPRAERVSASDRAIAFDLPAANAAVLTLDVQ